MNFGCRSSEKCAAAPTVWNNGTFTGANRADDWLYEASAMFRYAITLQTPVGYQDAPVFTGVSHAVPVRASARKQRPIHFDPG
ncbi:MAG: hypothetical protein JF609_11865 [Verrucomicrobia bacterium]|nr:hypothetical protein [Verrucomicrobiota bacterium]